MSPVRIEEPTGFFTPVPVNKTIFPDGFKTSGQHEPIYSLIKPYEEFPTQIEGPTVWKARDYENNPEKWSYRFSIDEVAEIGACADNFIDRDLPLTGITKVCYP